jgi:hypothetical protein
MKKLTWGIVLVAFGVLAIVGAGNNPQGAASAIIGGLLFILIGDRSPSRGLGACRARHD